MSNLKNELKKHPHVMKAIKRLNNEGDLRILAQYQLGMLGKKGFTISDADAAVLKMSKEN